MFFLGIQNWVSFLLLQKYKWKKNVNLTCFSTVYCIVYDDLLYRIAATLEKVLVSSLHEMRFFNFVDYSSATLLLGNVHYRTYAFSNSLRQLTVSGAATAKFLVSRGIVVWDLVPLHPAIWSINFLGTTYLMTLAASLKQNRNY